MDPFSLLSLVLVTAALFSYANHRFVRLPTTIGVMVIALGMSGGLLVGDALGLGLREPVGAMLEQLDFSDAVLDVMLAFLLFAGALHVDLDRLREAKATIATLATASLLVATLVTGALVWAISHALGLDLPFLHALLFGALISPTDPIAVLGILESLGAPKRLETKIAGESLFNDGVAVVLFLVLVQLVDGGSGTSAGGIAALALREVGMGLGLGLGAGWLTYQLLRTVDDYQVEVLLTLALSMGLYSLARELHASGPLAVVVAGLFIGNSGRSYAMSAVTVERVDTFWELVDEILNVVLFVLIGMEVLVLELDGRFLLLGLAAIPAVLLARFVSVGAAVGALKRFTRELPPRLTAILTWGGLRGGISVALALSLSRSIPTRDALVTATYVVVIFSIVVQGLTIGALVRRLLPEVTDAAAAA